LWPIADAFFLVEEESLRAELFLPPDPVGAHVVGVAHSGDGIDSVITVLGWAVARNLRGMLAAGRLRGEQQRFGAILVLVSVTVSTLVESIALGFMRINSVLTRFRG